MFHNIFSTQSNEWMGRWKNGVYVEGSWIEKICLWKKKNIMPGTFYKSVDLTLWLWRFIFSFQSKKEPIQQILRLIFFSF